MGEGKDYCIVGFILWFQVCKGCVEKIDGKFVDILFFDDYMWGCWKGDLKIFVQFFGGVSSGWYQKK